MAIPPFLLPKGLLLLLRFRLLVGPFFFLFLDFLGRGWITLKSFGEVCVRLLPVFVYDFLGYLQSPRQIFVFGGYQVEHQHSFARALYAHQVIPISPVISQERPKRSSAS
jgi:hypothetical protein